MQRLQALQNGGACDRAGGVIWNEGLEVGNGRKRLGKTLMSRIYTFCDNNRKVCFVC